SIAVFAIATIVLDQIFELFRLIFLGDPEAGPELFYFMVILLVVPIFAGARYPRFSVYSQHIFIYGFIITAIFNDDAVVQAILLALAVFLAGYLIRPIMAVVYGSLAYTFYTFLLTDISRITLGHIQTSTVAFAILIFISFLVASVINS